MATMQSKRLAGRSLVSIDDLSPTEVQRIFRTATRLGDLLEKKRLPKLLRDQRLGTIFFEPSTRTRLSFEAAMVCLGGGVLSVPSTASSSDKTPEGVARMMEAFGSDAVVLRHSETGVAAHVARAIRIPLINAGDGTGEHPTQALTDGYTIQKCFGSRRRRLNVTILGDLAHGRTVHSLVRLLSATTSHRLRLVSPESLRLPSELMSELRDRGATIEEHDRLDGLLACTDVLYVTRIQRERMSPELYASVFGSYTVDLSVATKLPKHAIILHPLPRVGDIAFEVDVDPRTMYFKQAAHGLHIRMALLSLFLGARIP